ncbi:Hypothetical protein CINCED_3A017475 [Cinara cedri]|uniref:Insect cuticle protein n=1 Tax=Cinara cedri TaxID=506608 RepID=A0A5E4MTI1_9HEMI|nr:Hypothetical protein CINCED_3A017475 [Cinara cedri]
MAMKFIVFASSLMAVALAQQRPVPPAFTRSGSAGRFNAQLELESNQQVPQPFRRVSVPLYRGRGFSLDGQEPKQTPQIQQQAFLQPRPTTLPNENPEFSRVGNNNAEENAADFPQPTRQAPQLQQQQQVDRNQLQAERFQQQQQHQQIDRIQQQQQLLDKNQHEKQFPNFRPQPQIQPVAETQPQFVRKVVQKPLKRVKVTEETVAPVRTPEMIQRMKVERSEASDKQRAKKPVSQVLRRYRDDNPDGSITWGFENDDGTFKEETIGVDCVTRGKYGYVDPEGVKREYSYTSGIPCDKNRKTIIQPLVGAGSSAVQEAQASDTYGYIDYTKNQYVMANGNTINLNGMTRNRARKPVVRKTATTPQPPQATANENF